MLRNDNVVAREEAAEAEPRARPKAALTAGGRSHGQTGGCGAAPFFASPERRRTRPFVPPRDSGSKLAARLRRSKQTQSA